MGEARFLQDPHKRDAPYKLGGEDLPDEVGVDFVQPERPLRSRKT
jgi:hypothetical protein